MHLKMSSETLCKSVPGLPTWPEDQLPLQICINTTWLTYWLLTGKWITMDLPWQHCQHYFWVMKLYIQFLSHIADQHMMTSSNGNIFCVTGHLCREYTGPRWVPLTKASDAELWCFIYFDRRQNKQLGKQWCGWWFETPSIPLWRHCNEF